MRKRLTILGAVLAVVLGVGPASSAVSPTTPLQQAESLEVEATQLQSSAAAMKAKAATLVKTLREESGKEPPPPPSMKIGINSGYWGSSELADLKGNIEYTRLDTPSNISSWAGIGEHVIGDLSGPYNEGGVQAINASTWVANAIAWWKANPQAYAIEVLNEPGGDWFWGKGALSEGNAAAYDRLLKLLHEELLKLPTRPVVLASFDGGHDDIATWGEYMLKADPNVLNYFDYPTSHPYGGKGTRATASLGRRSLVERIHTMTGRRVWVTEIGFPTISETGDSLKYTEQEQATNLTGFCEWARASNIVEGIAWYGYRDGSGAKGYGLVHENDSKKPGWAALVEQAKK